jgi:hypothetical protein
MMLVIGAAVCGQGAESSRGGRDPGPVYYLVASDTPADFRRGGVNVKFCDGTADDVQAQEWADQIATDGFGTIRFMAGSYTFGDCVLLDNNTIVEGSGQGEVTITLAAAVDDPAFTNEDWDEDASFNSNITLRNLTVDGNRDNQVGNHAIKDALGNSGTLWFGEVNDLLIENVRIDNSHRAAICIVQSNNIRVEGCRIDNTNDDGIGIDDGCSRAVVSNCIMTDIGKSNDYGGPGGVEVQDGSHEVVVTGNVITCSTTHGSATPVGILLTSHTGEAGVYNVVIKGNTIVDGTSGINCGSGTMADAERPRDVTVSGNAIRVGPDLNTNCYGIMLNYGYDISATGNTFRKDDVGSRMYYFRIENVEDAVIANNKGKVLSGGTNGADVAVYGANPVWKRVKIVDNVFTNLDYTFFRFEDSTGLDMEDVVIDGNVLSSPDVATNNVAMWNDDTGGTYTRCVWGDQHLAESITLANYHYLYSGSNFGGSAWEEEIHPYVVPDSGDASHGTLTIYPNKRKIHLTCSDAHGGTITMDETDAQIGWRCEIFYTGANHADFTDSAGVLELTGGAALAMDDLDVLVLEYNGSTWVEVSRAVN